MTTNVSEVEIRDQDGILIGPLRAPRNLAHSQRGSIHDDATAQKLGFRGGTVAGSIHMEQFPPLLVRAFGERWFETGSLSTYFRNATTDGERVRAFCEQPPPGAADAQVRVWMERDDGTLVLEGTASAGDTQQPSMLERKLEEPREAGEQRILRELHAGAVQPVHARLASQDAAPRLRAITEPLDWYTGASPWGGAIAHPGLVVHLLVSLQRTIPIARAGAVGLYGAIEVRHLRGPVFMEHDYEVSGRVLAVGQTPKTEYLWYESVASEPGGDAVASMIMMLRFMKASSPLWQAG
jgi:hypothetical protein